MRHYCIFLKSFARTRADRSIVRAVVNEINSEVGTQWQNHFHSEQSAEEYRMTVLAKWQDKLAVNECCSL